jgi:endothelin-converting enzyme/putative endopeptidase
MRTAAISCLLVAVVWSHPSPAQNGDELKFDIHAVDKSVNPCADFYQYACGGWLKTNPVPPDRPYSAVFQQMREIDQKRVAGILEQAASAPSTPQQQKIGDYYASCMDEKAIDIQGLRPLQAELVRIDAVTTPAELASEIAQLHRYGASAMFSMGADQKLEDATQVIAYLDQSDLNLPEPGYYISDDSEMVKLRAEYQTHLQNEFKLLGESAEQAKQGAEDVMKIEAALARSELTPVERRDRKAWYHLMNSPELEKLAPDFRWRVYFSAIGFTPTGEINVAIPKYMQAIATLMSQTPIVAWKHYLRWELIRAATPVLPKPFRDADFNFFQRTLAGVKEQPLRAKQCTDLTNRDLGEAVGKEYARRYFPASSKQQVLEMVGRIRQAFQNDVEQSTWMDASTKREALRKLDLLRAMIGYPDHWRDYSSLEIRRGDALGNALRSQEFEFRRQIAKIGKPVDRGEFYELVQGVEGYHDNPLNVIVFTAGILQPPFFDPHVDDAVNFGLAGAVMGHELSHAFDDKGHQFDGEGNMRNWWTPEDAQHYDARAGCFVRQYSSYSAVDDVKVNGELTLGENIADNGGLQLAHRAFEATPHSMQTIDGYTPEQRFFLGWAQWRCMNVTEEKARQLARNDEHSPGRWRVNGVVSNMPAFANAYQCKRGDVMVRAEPCRIW